MTDIDSGNVYWKSVLALRDHWSRLLQQAAQARFQLSDLLESSELTPLLETVLFPLEEIPKPPADIIEGEDAWARYDVVMAPIHDRLLAKVESIVRRWPLIQPDNPFAGRVHFERIQIGYDSLRDQWMMQVRVTIARRVPLANLLHNPLDAHSPPPPQLSSSPVDTPAEWLTTKVGKMTLEQRDQSMTMLSGQKIVYMRKVA